MSAQMRATVEFSHKPPRRHEQNERTVLELMYLGLQRTEPTSTLANAEIHLTLLLLVRAMDGLLLCYS